LHVRTEIRKLLKRRGRTLDTAGTFNYTCHIHPDMQGMVVVE
jgi:plastocyanin